MDREQILVVDDEPGIRDQLYWALNSEYQVHRAGTPDEAIAVVDAHAPDLVILDINLGGSDDSREGIDLIGEIIDRRPDTKVVMVTGHGQRDNALACIKRGAYDFFAKPVDVESLKVVISRALYLRRLEMEHRRLRDEVAAEERFGEIVGISESMRRVFTFIESVAGNDYTVLITGESGTGKELVARAIHHRSPRSGYQMAAINCGAIPENLLESELFGFEKGAFTDAAQRRIGRLEQADGGTIFLDEIGEMPLKLQVKLLRFLEDRKVQRIGGNELIELDVRIIAATNVDLKERVEAGAFREDLFYRLSVLHVELPPLRQRGEDIIFLANHFLTAFAEENNRKGLRFSTRAIREIERSPWPGNVRELENRVKRAVILARGKTIEPADLTLDRPDTPESIQPVTLQQVREQAETEHIRRALTAHNWNISRVSRELEISRTTLYELIEKYGLRKDGRG